MPGKLAPQSWRSTIEEVGDAGAVDDGLFGARDADEGCCDDPGIMLDVVWLAA